MSGLFSKPKTPRIEAPPPTPVVDQSARERAERDAAARRRGRRATVVAGSQASSPSVGKTVLGG